METKNTLYQDFGSGEDLRFLSRFPFLFQPVCGGLPQVVRSDQLQCWTEIANHIDIAIVAAEIYGSETVYRPRPQKGKFTILNTSEGQIKLTTFYDFDFKGYHLVEVLNTQDYRNVRLATGQIFRRMVSALDFLYNYWVVFSESHKFLGDRSLTKSYLLSDMLAPIVPLLRVNTCDHIKIFKYCTVYPLAAARTLHKGPNPLPAEPLVFDSKIREEVPVSSIIPWYVFNGSIGKRFRSIVQGKVTASTKKFCHDIQETKRGCPVVPVEFVEQALHDHRESIKKPHTPPEGGEVEEILFGDRRARMPVNSHFSVKGYWTNDYFESRFNEILDFVLPGLLGDLKLKPKDWYHVRPMSTKACFEVSQNKGGARTHLRDQIFEEFGFCSYSTGLHTMYAVRVGRAKETRTSILCPDRDIMEFLWATACDHVKVEPRCNAKVKDILEPLKVRVITKSEALPQYLSIPLQKALHGALRKRKIFALLDRPISGDLIDDLVKRSGDEGCWRSGDYKGATDGLAMWISKKVVNAVLDMVCGWMTKTERQVLISNLVDQYIWYPYYDDTCQKWLYKVVDQNNGQLMGSILSFPILCIINYLTYFMSVSPLFLEFEHYILGSRTKPLSTRELDKELLLVNGDDILFKATDSEYIHWEKTLPFFGFKLSLGKNLCSENMLMINSTLFSRKTQHDHKDFFLHVPYPNIGLLKGRSKVGGNPETLVVDHKPLWTIYSEIQNGYGPNLPKLYSAWNRERLNHYSENGKYNYYGPRELGCVGLYDPQAQMTAPQRALATSLLHHMEKYGEQGLVTPGLVSEDSLVSGVSDTWNDCGSPQPRLGFFIPIRQPVPAGFTDRKIDRSRLFHPLDGDFGEEPQVIFRRGTGKSLEYVPEESALSTKRILSYTEGFRFVRRDLVS